MLVPPWVPMPVEDWAELDLETWCITPLDGLDDEARTDTFLDDLAIRRMAPTAATNSNRLDVELNGGSYVEITSFEPDPATFRDDFYYNAVSNTLYKKIVVSQCNGITSAFWKQASD